MLERILYLKNVGPFVEFGVGSTATDDARRIAALTVIYAHNGRGKSTLADVLRSLGSGDTTVFSARRRLGSSESPAAAFRVAGKPIAFADGKWTWTVGGLTVFDETFVNENVYSGFDVGTNQLRNLGKLVIGEKGVVLQRRSDDLAAEISSLQVEQRRLAKEIQPKIEGMEITAFCSLARVEDVDTAISEAEKQIARLAAADTIKSTASFSPPMLRLLDIERLAKFLSTTVATIGAEARQLVETRTKNLGVGAEQWLAEGLRFGARPSCPFCTQPTDGLEILEQYEAYFGAEYTAHKEAVAKSRDQLDEIYGPQAQKRAVLALQAQETLRAFWTRHLTGVPAEVVPSEELDTAWTEGYREIARLLGAKRAATLDMIAIDADSKARLVRLADATRAANEFMDALMHLNPELERLKQDAQVGSVSAAKADLSRLRNAKARHTEPLASLCDRHQELATTIEDKKALKATAKAALEVHNEAVGVATDGRQERARVETSRDRSRVGGLERQ